MTIDELARAADTTTRNIRALQTSSLLIKPEIVGRTARYGEAHLERLVTVLRLQSQGFSIASIRALFEAMSSGKSLGDVLGVPADPPGEEGSVARFGRGRFGSGLSPDPYGDSLDQTSDQIPSPAFGTGPPRHLRLLSDIPTTVLDPAV
jgi:DNA-binding transcriptional MerR regulator